MKNSKITWKITQGMYILTTEGGGCIVDAVSQVSGGEQPLIAIAVMKKNFTNELIKRNRTFALSVFGKNGDPQLIKTFGFQSMRDVDKFKNVNTLNVSGVKVIENSLGYMVCEKVDSIENETHTLFIGRVSEGDILNDSEPMSYAYYQEHKNELLKRETTEGKTAWVCTVCGYVYYGDRLPQDYECPICSVDASYFQKRDS